MSYHSMNTMAASQSLMGRVAACAAEEDVPNPATWAQTNMLKICSMPGWDDAWDYAVSTYTINQNPDTGARTDVISDAMILSAVQALYVA